MVTQKRRRIDWSPFELQKVVDATIDVMHREKISIPVTRLSKLLVFIKRGQEVLPSDRRRPFATTTSISNTMLTLFVDHGIFSRRHTDDPRDIRIAELEKQLDEERRLSANVLTQNQQLAQSLREQLARPSPQDYLKNLIKELVKEAMREIEDERKPAFMRPTSPPKPHIELPVVEVPKPPRKIPVTIVGGNRDKDYARMTEELGDKYEITYVYKPAAVQYVHAPHVIYWTRWSDHALQRALKKHNVKFTYFGGSLSALIDFIRETVHE